MKKERKKRFKFNIGSVSGPRKTTIRAQAIAKMILVERVLFMITWAVLHWFSPFWYGYNWWSTWILFVVDSAVLFVSLYYYLRHKGIDES